MQVPMSVCPIKAKFLCDTLTSWRGSWIPNRRLESILRDARPSKTSSLTNILSPTRILGTSSLMFMTEKCFGGFVDSGPRLYGSRTKPGLVLNSPTSCGLRVVRLCFAKVCVTISVSLSCWNHHIASPAELCNTALLREFKTTDSLESLHVLSPESSRKWSFGMRHKPRRKATRGCCSRMLLRLRPDWPVWSILLGSTSGEPSRKPGGIRWVGFEKKNSLSWVVRKIKYKVWNFRRNKKQVFSHFFQNKKHSALMSTCNVFFTLWKYKAMTQKKCKTFILCFGFALPLHTSMICLEILQFTFCSWFQLFYVVLEFYITNIEQEELSG